MSAETPAGRSHAELALKIANDIRQLVTAESNPIVLGDDHTRINLKLRVLYYLDDLEETLSEIPS